MVKTRSSFVCGACGTVHARWQGKCDGCGEWSTVCEEAAVRVVSRSRPGRAAGPIPLTEVPTTGAPRRETGLAEFDRVLGGGLVAGSAVLVAGDPGIGKSTLLLQAAAGLAAGGSAAGSSAAGGGRTLYVSGEESPAQTRLRAERLGIASPEIHLLAETDLDTIRDAAWAMKPELLVLDSIQTAHRAEVSSAPGSPAQVRDCAAELTKFAKATGIPVVMIGHVTKTGDIAGPRVLAHVVDTVLSFEGDRYHAYRVLRAVKNRFGTTDEVGIFEMRAEGLVEVGSPSGLLLQNGASAGPGSVVVPAAEGTRILLVEVQALASPAPQPPSRRRVTGLDPRRMDLLLAVLERKGGLQIGGQDVFVNAVGGVRVDEPGTDLAAALAVASSFTERPLPEDCVAFGEVGLKGEVRPVPRARARLAEAVKLGFRKALVPPGTDAPRGIEAVEVKTVGEALERLG